MESCSFHCLRGFSSFWRIICVICENCETFLFIPNKYCIFAVCRIGTCLEPASFCIQDSILNIRKMYIAVAGNIGSGKTTLTKMLSKHYGWKQYLEPVAENPYIDDYYKDIPRWALNMEVFYLKQRFKNLLEIQHCKETVIQDRTILRACMSLQPIIERWVIWTSATSIPIWNSSSR